MQERYSFWKETWQMENFYYQRAIADRLSELDPTYGKNSCYLRRQTRQVSKKKRQLNSTRKNADVHPPPPIGPCCGMQI